MSEQTAHFKLKGQDQGQDPQQHRATRISEEEDRYVIYDGKQIVAILPKDQVDYCYLSEDDD